MDFFKALHGSRSDFVRFGVETTKRNFREPAWLVFWAILAGIIIYNGVFRA